MQSVNAAYRPFSLSDRHARRHSDRHYEHLGETGF